MYWSMYIGIALVVGIFIYALMYPNWRRNHLVKLTHNNVYVTTLTRHGRRVNELAPITRFEDKESGQITETAKLKHGGTILLSPEATFTMDYPAQEITSSFLKRWFSPTVSMESITVPEGYADAYIPFKTDEEIAKLRATQLEGLQSDKLERTISAHTEMYANPDQLKDGTKAKQVKLILYGTLASVALLIAVGVLTYMNYTTITEFAEAWGV